MFLTQYGHQTVCHCPPLSTGVPDHARGRLYAPGSYTHRELLAASVGPEHDDVTDGPFLLHDLVYCGLCGAKDMVTHSTPVHAPTAYEVRLRGETHHRVVVFVARNVRMNSNNARKTKGGSKSLFDRQLYLDIK